MIFSFVLIAFAALAVNAQINSGGEDEGAPPQSTCGERAVLESASFDLIVGNPKNTRVVGGSVELEVSGDEVKVTVDGNAEWDIKHVHVFAGGVWPFGESAPAPGSFAINEAVTELPFSTTFTLGEGELADLCGTLTLAVHTESVGRGDENAGQEETGWADAGVEFPGARWGAYHEACLEGCVDEAPPGGEEGEGEEGESAGERARRKILERFNRRANGEETEETTETPSSEDTTETDGEETPSSEDSSESPSGESDGEPNGKANGKGKERKVRQIVVKGMAKAEQVRTTIEKALGRKVKTVKTNDDGSVTVDFIEELTPEEANLVASSILSEVDLVTDLEPILAPEEQAAEPELDGSAARAISAVALATAAATMLF